MSGKVPRNFGKQIADAVRNEIGSGSGDGDQSEGGRSWLSDWTNPVSARDRSRRWLSWGLEGALQDIPDEQVIRFLNQMAEDIRRLGTDEARVQFIDNILPRLLSNQSPR